MSKLKRKYELVLWGATGFTGALVARHLVDTYGDELHWALAGRNLEKLQALRESLAMPGLPLIQADSADRASLDAMASSARVICTTVGPYALYGDLLLAACAEAGTHYCDLTGEVQWMARSIERHLATARDSGARIVHTCGFDSIPTDLGTWYLQEQMFERHGEYADVAKSRVGDFSGGASGGTIASMLQMLEEASGDPAVREALANPYSLNPEGEQWGPDEIDSNLPQYDPDLGQWTAPFVMAAINTRVVRRSNALAGYPWGVDFRVDERLLTGDGMAGKARAAAIGIGSGLTPLAMGLKPLRKVAGRLLPSPGEGPSPEEQRRGHFELFLHGRNLGSDNSLMLRVSGDRDPGYGATSRMLGEAAVCLARDDLDCSGGVWTPATAMAGRLVERLQAKAGVSFEVVDD